MNFKVLLATSLVAGFADASGQALFFQDPTSLAKEEGFYLTSHASFSLANDFISLKELNKTLNDRYDASSGGYGARPGTNLAFLFFEAGLGLRFNEWSLSWIHRRDVLLKASKDATYFAYANKVARGLPVGSRLQMQVDIQGHEFDGLRVSKGLTLWESTGHRIKAGYGVTLLQGSEYRTTSGEGTIQSTLLGYEYAGGWNQAYSQDTYPYLRNAKPQGTGYTLDAAVQIEAAGAGVFNLIANDILSEVNWKNMPYTQVSANSMTLSRDQYGYVVFNPTLSGTNDVQRRTVKERIPTRWTTYWEIPMGARQLKFGNQRVWGEDLPFIGLTQQLGGDSTIGLSHDFRMKSWQLNWSSSRLSFGVYSSQTLLSETRAFGLSASYRYSLM